MVGYIISHHRIVEKLSIVYQAEDITLNDFVALEFLTDDIVLSIGFLLGKWSGEDLCQSGTP